MPRHAAKENELLLIPKTRTSARLLLRPDDTFVSVCNAKAAFGSGHFNVTGKWSREGDVVTLTALHSDEDGALAGEGDDVLQITVCGESPLVAAGRAAAGTLECEIPASSDTNWLDPPYEE